MEATSRHYGDVILWLEKVIESCVTVGQVHSTLNLILAFERKYNERTTLTSKAKRKMENIHKVAMQKDIENGLITN